MRVIDAHVHMWSVRGTPREASTFVRLLGWSPSLMHGLAKRLFPREVVAFYGRSEYLLQDYLPADVLADADIDGFVHVEASWRGPDPVDETRWLEGLECPQLLGIVGAADLTLGAGVRDVLRAHREASPRFRGIRAVLAHHPERGVLDSCSDPHRIDDPTWRRGFEVVAELDLSFDATIYHHQLPDLTRLARDFPETRIVLDHAGSPIGLGGPFGGVTDRDRIDREWREGLRQLAECPNVCVKISGLLMPAIGVGFDASAGDPDPDALADRLGPWVTFLVDTFGPTRCMFASNFPIEKVSTSWSALYDAFGRIVAGHTPSDREALFAGTAAWMYRLSGE